MYMYLHDVRPSMCVCEFFYLDMEIANIRYSRVISVISVVHPTPSQPKCMQEIERREQTGAQSPCRRASTSRSSVATWATWVISSTPVP